MGGTGPGRTVWDMDIWSLLRSAERTWRATTIRICRCAAGCWLLKHFQRIKKRSRGPEGEGSVFNALAVEATILGVDRMVADGL